MQKNKNLFLNKNEYYILNEYKQIGSNDLKGIGFDKKVVIFNDKLNTITKDLIENRATKSFSLKNKCLQKKILFFKKKYQYYFWRLNDMIHFLTYYELIKNKYNNYNNNFNNLNNPSLFQLYDNYIFNSNEKVSNYNLSNFKEIKTDNKIEYENGNIFYYTSNPYYKILKGNGKMIYKSGHIYEGNWSNNERNGFGKMTYKSGHIYEGNWLNDEKNGFGYMNFPNGSKYSGSWKNNKKHGKGVLFKIDENNSVIFSSNWINNNMDGECKIVYSNGDYYNGQIKNNKLIGNGKCKKTFYTSCIGNKPIKYIYEGSLLDGKKWIWNFNIF